MDLRSPDELTAEMILTLVENQDRPTISTVAEQVRFPTLYRPDVYKLNVVRYIRRMIDSGILAEDRTEPVPVLVKYNPKDGEEVWEHRTGLSGGTLTIAADRAEF